METSIHLMADDMTDAVLLGIKEMFRGKTITITVTDAVDETEYLNSTAANRRILEERIHAVESNSGLQHFSGDELAELVKKAIGKHSFA